MIYSDITDVKFIYRMGGTVGDMVLTLTDGAKLEMRHVPEFRQVRVWPVVVRPLPVAAPRKETRVTQHARQKARHVSIKPL